MSITFLRKTSLYILAIPMLFTVLGTASNQLVLSANHDKFPVMWNDYKASQYALSLEKAGTSDNEDSARQATFDLLALQKQGFLDDTHCLMTPKTHLNFLADWIDFKSETDSPGDLLLDLGGWLWNFAPVVWGVSVIRKLNT
jgi:hypothetical protein